MKYIIILGDGMSDEPIAEYGGKTPLQMAKATHRLAGKTWSVRTINNCA